jgi:hypothetical protein
LSITGPSQRRLLKLICGPKEPAIWKYFFKEHMIQHHPDVGLVKYSHLWELSKAEKTAMKDVWDTQDKQKKLKKIKCTLVILQAHSSFL